MRQLLKTLWQRFARSALDYAMIAIENTVAGPVADSISSHCRGRACT